MQSLLWTGPTFSPSIVYVKPKSPSLRTTGISSLSTIHVDVRLDGVAPTDLELLSALAMAVNLNLTRPLFMSVDPSTSILTCSYRNCKKMQYSVSWSSRVGFLTLDTLDYRILPVETTKVRVHTPVHAYMAHLVLAMVSACTPGMRVNTSYPYVVNYAHIDALLCMAMQSVKQNGKWNLRSIRVYGAYDITNMDNGASGTLDAEQFIMASCLAVRTPSSPLFPPVIAEPSSEPRFYSIYDDDINTDFSFDSCLEMAEAENHRVEEALGLCVNGLCVTPTPPLKRHCPASPPPPPSHQHTFVDTPLSYFDLQVCQAFFCE